MEEKEPKAVSRTRDKEGKVENYHLNDIANTVHSSTGGGGNTDCYVAEPRVMQVGNIYEDTDNFKNRTMGRVYSGRGLSPTINCCGGGDREPKIVEPHSYRIRKLTPRECFRLMDVAESDIDKLLNAGISNSQLYKLASGRGLSPTINCCGGGDREPKIVEPHSYRIRKLTPRECFRLMDVAESDIDKLLNAGISNSQLYKLAGNSICVGVLYHIIRKLFIEKENEHQQLTLF